MRGFVASNTGMDEFHIMRDDSLSWRTSGGDHV